MYSIKEIYKTIQGEGAHSGRSAVFVRFSGCNLWSGKEKHRKSAICNFCDTDFVGTDGENGGNYSINEILDIIYVNLITFITYIFMLKLSMYFKIHFLPNLLTTLITFI